MLDAIESFFFNCGNNFSISNDRGSSVSVISIEAKDMDRHVLLLDAEALKIWSACEMCRVTSIACRKLRIQRSRCYLLSNQMK